LNISPQCGAKIKRLGRSSKIRSSVELKCNRVPNCAHVRPGTYT
jgi:hypothetical protein